RGVWNMRPPLRGEVRHGARGNEAHSGHCTRMQDPKQPGGSAICRSARGLVYYLGAFSFANTSYTIVSVSVRVHTRNAYALKSQSLPNTLIQEVPPPYAES